LHRTLYLKQTDSTDSPYRLHEEAEPTRPLNYADLFRAPLREGELELLSDSPNAFSPLAIWRNLWCMARGGHDLWFATAPSLHVVLAHFVGLERGRYRPVCWATAHRSRLRRWIFGRQMRFARRILVNDSRTMEELQRDWAVPAEKIVWVPFGVDLRYYTPAEICARSHLLVPGDAVRDEDFVLELAGAGLGPVYRGIKDRGIRDFYAARSSAGVDVRYLRPFSEIRANYQHARAVIIPVLNDREPSGLTALLEGMACGRPCFINEGRTTLEYVKDGVTGFILKGARDTWLAQVRCILANEAALERVGRAARAHVAEHHDWRKVLPIWHQALKG
jgi:glycosyltransferase involved in cell wall biosynthesis